MISKDDIVRHAPMPVFEGFKLAQVTTFQVGGPCRGMVHCRTPEEAIVMTRFFIRHDLPYILMGGGSNLVVSDDGIDCYVIRYITERADILRRDNGLYVSGATVLDELANWAANEGLEGLNYTSGIPGTVGGSIIGNAGAYGKQVGDILVSAEVLTRDGRTECIDRKRFDFRYRDSALRDRGGIILKVCFQMTPGNRDDLLREREEILRDRTAKHPDWSRIPCAGSFFRNIEPTSKAGPRQAAGWFLEQAGVKSYRCGGAEIYPKHANIIINSGQGTAADIYRLSCRMVESVREKFSLELTREVRFVGKVGDAPYDPKQPVW